MTEISPIIRPMEEQDIVRVGQVIVTAFNDIFLRHGFPRPFPSPDVGVALAKRYFALEPNECFVAAKNGRVVGSGFIHLRGDTAGVGPITVDPVCQAAGIGGALMRTVIRAGQQCSSLRLVQDAFNLASFSLYSKLGFAVRDTTAALVGQNVQLPDSAEAITVRAMTRADIAAVSTLDTQLTGITRSQDIQFFLNQPPQLIALSGKEIIGYLCLLRMDTGTFLGPAAATESAGLKALIAQANKNERSKVLRMRLPGRHTEMLHDLLQMGFRVEVLENYMVRGSWQPPPGVDLLALFPEAL